jgi:hypothetical protein
MSYLLVLLLAAIAAAIPFCNVTDASMLGCFSTLLDPQSTGNVSQTQLEHQLSLLNFTYGVTAAGIMHNCDVDQDGYLTADDWYNPNRTQCLNDYNAKLICCFACANNGYTSVLQKIMK